MCKKYLNEQAHKHIFNNSEKLKQKKEQTKFEMLKLDNLIESINKKIDACYNDKFEGNITVDMYKKTYNNLTLEIKKHQLEKGKYVKMLYNIDNNSLSNNKSYVKVINDFFNMKNLSSTLITSLIDKIEIDENNNIDIYYKFKLI